MSPAAIPLVQIDAFTSEAFGGNPAAVCLLPAARDEVWMQRIAAEMNLSETAFLVPRAATADARARTEFDLRWFTPAIEVALCGHATLASAHALWQMGTLAAGEQARFHTKSGVLSADRHGEWIELNFPATTAEPADPPTGLAAALGVRPTFVGKSRFDYLVEVDGEAVVRNAKPDFVALRTLPVRGVMITSRASTPGFDFV